MSDGEADIDFIHLQDRVDVLENVLCDLATATIKEGFITSFDLKKALQDAGILGKDAEVKP